MSVGGGEAVPNTGTRVSRGADRQSPIEGAELDEGRLVLAVLDGEEAAFAALVRRRHSMLVRMARLYVPDCVPEDLLQDVWVELLSRLDHLDAGVSLRVSLLKILLDRARHRSPAAGARIPFAADWDPSADSDAPSVDPSSFRTSEPWIGHWAVPVADWEQGPLAGSLSRSTLDRVEEALAMLPPAQREVITLRDVEGWTSSDVSDALGIAEKTQRLLLHRARARIRASLEITLREN